MAERGESDVCSTCNARRGTRTTVRFPDAGESVELSMCGVCYDEFAADALVDVERVDR
jgi:hypothetical protein